VRAKQYLLEAINLRLKKIVVERVTVVKFRMDNRGSDGTGCCTIEVRTDTVELRDMRISGLGHTSNSSNKFSKSYTEVSYAMLNKAFCFI